MTNNLFDYFEEVPVRVHYKDAASTTGWRAARQMIRDIFRIRRDWNASNLLPVARTMNIQELPIERRTDSFKAAA